MSGYRVPMTKCPSCGQEHDAVSGRKAAPVKGDLSICFRCEAVLIFEKDLTTRALTTSEWEALPPDVAAQLHNSVEALRNAKQRLHR